MHCTTPVVLSLRGRSGELWHERAVHNDKNEATKQQKNKNKVVEQGHRVPYDVHSKYKSRSIESVM